MPRSHHRKLTPPGLREATRSVFSSSPCSTSSDRRSGSQATLALVDDLQGAHRRDSDSTKSLRRKVPDVHNHALNISIPWFESRDDPIQAVDDEPDALEVITSSRSSSPKPLYDETPHTSRSSSPAELDNLERVSSKSCSVRSSAITSLPVEKVPPTQSPPLVYPTSADHSRSNSSTMRRHPRFYLSDGMITLEVEGALFRMHRYLLERESSYFRDVWSEDPLLGTSDDKAIILSGLTVQEFECLLHFMYYGVFEPHNYALDDWLDVLAAASLLKCSKLRRRVILELESPAFSASLDAVDRILLARRYEVKEWLLPAYVELCLREASLREQEIDLLGTKLTAQLCYIREKLMHEAVHSIPATPTTRGIKRSTEKSVRRAKDLLEEILG